MNTRRNRRLWIRREPGSRRTNWAVLITSIVFAVSCSGGGCGGCAGFEPIPGGFPAAKRNPNAVQVRVTQSGLGKITMDPAKVIGPLVGSAMAGVIEFPVPSSCGGDPEVCCNVANCGPLQIDLNLNTQQGDDARLVLTPVQGASRLDVALRARVYTKTDLPMRAFGLSCNVNIDTRRGTQRDLEVLLPMSFPTDVTAGTMRVEAGDVTINRLENEDVRLSGTGLNAVLCAGASWGIGLFIGTLKSAIADQIKSALGDAMCKGCPSGNVAECGRPRPAALCSHHPPGWVSWFHVA